jgi:TrpR-related protein YerC/YecD
MDHDHHHIDTVEELEHNESEDLFEALLLLKTRDEAQRFLKDLCTPQELTALKERWKVCKLLQQGDLSYRQINELAGTSLATIVRVARCLKDEPTHGYRTVLERMQIRKKA